MDRHLSFTKFGENTKREGANVKNVTPNENFTHKKGVPNHQGNAGKSFKLSLPLAKKRIVSFFPPVFAGSGGCKNTTFPSPTTFFYYKTNHFVGSCAGINA